MKVLFCDVDGVLNNNKTKERSPNGYTGVSNDLIRKLKEIVSATGACIVLSSDWRLIADDPVYGRDYRYLVKKLRYIGNLSIFDATDDISWNQRGKEITEYLRNHPDVEEYVILDDILFESFAKQDLLCHLVHTNGRKGLTDTDVMKAIRILNGEF